MLLMITRFSVPIGLPSGARMRLPNRMKMGALMMSRIEMLVTVMSSSMAPSTVSSASPWHPSNTQFEMVMLRKPPSDSVPNLMRPVPPPCGANLL